jgi:hypothetical protein
VTNNSQDGKLGNWGDPIGMKPEDLITMARERADDHDVELSPNDHCNAAGKIGEAVGKIITKRKVGKHLHRNITDTSFTYHRDQSGIDAEAALDGIYVLRTSVAADTLTPAAVVESYKNLAHLKGDFRSIKTDDLDLRLIHHRLDERVKAHVLICLLACYLVWHLRKAWAPLTYTDEHPPARDNPVAPAQRSPAAQAKTSRYHDPDGNPLHSFHGLLDHLATLTRNDIHYHGTKTDVPTLAEPTQDQHRVFDPSVGEVPSVTTIFWGSQRFAAIKAEPVLEKATTSLRARAELDPPDFAQITDGVELAVPVTVTVRSGTEVVHADITTWVTPIG